MPEAYIIDTVRTPVGRRGGSLAQVHPADLGAHTLKALMERTGIDPGAVEEFVFFHHPSARHRIHDAMRWREAMGTP